MTDLFKKTSPEIADELYFGEQNNNADKNVKLDFAVETITPEKARQYLETSPHNRITNTSKRKTIAQYAKAMKRGEWRLNGEAIIFDKEGRLSNGHHRLMAVCEAEVPVKMAVIRGVERSAFTTYNCGLRTNLGQVLGMIGIPNANNVSSILNVNLTLCKTGRVVTPTGGASIIDLDRTITSDRYEFAEHKDDYIEAAEFAQRTVNRLRILKTSWVGGLYFYLTHTGGYEPEKVKIFFESICTLDNSNIEVCDLLRKYIIRRNTEKMKLEDSHLQALLYKTWNAYVQGFDLKVIKFNPEVETYPKLKLNI